MMKTTTTRERHLIDAVSNITTPPKGKEIGFQHTVLCQTALPHRPTKARTWEREQGNVSLSIEAGRIKRGQKWVELLLPYGEKPRLLLIHLNSEAVRTSSPIIDIGRSMTGFIKTLGIEPNGAHIHAFKDQALRLATANIRFAVGDGKASVQGQMQIVKAFALWPQDQHQRSIWPTTLRLSDDYFNALQGHAVPLDQRAVMALRGSSLLLDIYGWMAQRLHRIPASRPQHISWPAVKSQFGVNYGRERAFRGKFTKALDVVQAAYPAARFEVTDDGLTLFHSPSPVPKRLVKGGLLLP